MQYIIVVTPEGASFDESVMTKALALQKEIGSADFILFAGWHAGQSNVTALWQLQRDWLLTHGVESRYLVTPEHMSWPGSVCVNTHGKAMSVFDQMLCVSYLTTDDVFSKGELFFVGPTWLRELTLELAAFLKIPRRPEEERCEYYDVDAHGPSPLFATRIQQALGVLRTYRRGLPMGWRPRWFRRRTFLNLQKNEA